MHYKWWQNAITKKKKKCTPRKLQKKILYLGLHRWRVLLKISLLGLRVPNLRLKPCILGLVNYIPDGEHILRGIGLYRWLSHLTHSIPFRNFSIRRRGLSGREGLG